MAIQGKNIYNYRGYIRRLYYLSNSLEIDIKDKLDGNSVIKDLEIDLENFYIGILVHNNTKEDMDDIINMIYNSIQQFVLDNIDKISISESEKEEFDEFVNNPKLLCDLTVVGKLIKFSL